MKHGYIDLACGQMYREVEGTGYPVICLHQTIWSSWEYHKLIPLLSPEYRVIALDTMGFGRSDPAPFGWLIDDYGDTVIEALDKLEIEKAHFIGQHTGAFLSVAIAARHPDRINKIVLSGCGLFNPDFVPFTPEPTGLWQVSTVTQNLRERIANRSGAPSYDIPLDGSHLIMRWANQLHENPAAPMDAIQKAFISLLEQFDKRGGAPFGALLKFDLEATAPLVQNPTLLTIGTKDCFYPPVCREPDAVAHLIPNCKVAWVEGAGIMSFYSHPREYAKLILDFLKDDE
jgi:pimeloyl-ACP methyl ester carboxylesterase